jgi:hypothetical protein
MHYTTSSNWSDFIAWILVGIMGIVTTLVIVGLSVLPPVMVIYFALWLARHFGVLH